MDEEIREAYKRDFLEFFEQDVGKGICMDEIKAMINHKRYRIIIGVSDLHSFRDLAPRVLRNPTNYSAMQSPKLLPLFLAGSRRLRNFFP